MLEPFSKTFITHFYQPFQFPALNHRRKTTCLTSSRIHERWKNPGAEIKKGDEIGHFQFGGSSIIVAFQPGRIKFDQDLLDLSLQRIQVSVEVGMSLGGACI